MASFEVRTDLAVEEQEQISGEISGVSLREWRGESSDLKWSQVRVLNNGGAKTLGKPVGAYLTLEMKPLPDSGQGLRIAAARELARQIRVLFRQMSGDRYPTSVLVTGLGNQLVTADSLGPKTVGSLHVTRHVDRAASVGTKTSLSALSPGVMAQTGMETAEILRGVIRETRPDLLIVIDALAARSVARLGTTIQLTDTGIRPGSGVGNHRHELSAESLGLPVLAIGVPTVVGAAAIVHDTINAILRAPGHSAASAAAAATDPDADGFFRMLRQIKAMDPDEQYEWIRRLTEPECGSLYVTPPNIDEIVGDLSDIIAESIHQAIFPDLDPEDER
ncbi:MAG: GPR endopeptidase [Clostridiales bacterium]|nr:GPR endopeptidase [Clostridiales bacterium]